VSPTREPNAWYREQRDRLSDLARDGEWSGLFDELRKHPERANLPRIGNRTGYAPLHQAAWHGADFPVVSRLIAHGAWRTQRTRDGQRAVDGARKQGHTHLLELLEPVVVRPLPPPPELLEHRFHSLLRERTGSCFEETETNPFTIEEAKAFLRAAAKPPTFMRWVIGVGQGFRPGETLGFRWPYVDLDNGLFHPKWQLQGLTWRHGCQDAHACGERLHRFEPCPPDCTMHKNYKRGCPKPCPPDCVKHASICPERKSGDLVFTRPKTKKSTSPVPIAPSFIPYLRAHKKEQDAMKEAAGDAWQDYNLVFCRPDGSPIDPHDDWEEFKELLEEAGITDRRLYDGSRHTAGTILNELGVDMPTIMEILRHTQISQTRRYVKGRSHLSKDAMRRMGDTFLPAPEPAPEPPTETGTETRDRRAARAQRRRRIR